LYTLSKTGLTAPASIRYEEAARWMTNPKSFQIIAIHTAPDLNDRSKLLNKSGKGIPRKWYCKEY